MLEAHERGDHGLVGSPVGESGEGAARPAAREPSAREAIEECAELQHELEQTRCVAPAGAACIERCTHATLTCNYMNLVFYEHNKAMDGLSWLIASLLPPNAKSWIHTRTP